jgi:hypothetical protein
MAAVDLYQPQPCRDGVNANDKFCLSRFGRLQLSWWRLPLRARQSRLAESSSPQDLAAAGGNDAGLADTPDISAPSGRAATVGPGLSATPGMDTTSGRLRRRTGRPRASETGGQS